MSKPVILLAIDGREEREALATQIGSANIVCQCVDQPTELVAELDKAQPATVIVDISFGGSNAHQLLRSSALKLNGTPVVFRARRSASELELALEASLSGAGHFLLAPHGQGELGQIIDRARCYFHEQRSKETALSPSCTTIGNGVDDSLLELGELLVGSSRAIREIRAQVGRVAAMRGCLLIRGETGTGKELVAKVIHDVSPRRDGPWVVVNTSMIPAGEGERILFGSRVSERGGDWVVHPGKCDLAVGGTLFLDELGDLEPSAQLSLLRSLERQGAVIESDSEAKTIRLVVATSRDPEQLVSSGRLREDLYRHLQGVSILLPPLRDRMEDLVPLAKHFLRQAARLQGRPVEGFSDRALGELSRFTWPGNLDQLRNVIERLAAAAPGPIVATATIPADLRAVRPVRPARGAVRTGHLQAFSQVEPEPDLTPLQRQERLLIIEALRQTGDNVVDAARLLKMGQATVYRKIRQYHIAHTRRRRKRV